MIGTMYISKLGTELVNGFFKNGSWNWDSMTSMLFRNMENGKLIQVFGYGCSYKSLEGHVKAISDQSGRVLGDFRFVDYHDEVEKASVAKYVLK